MGGILFRLTGKVHTPAARQGAVGEPGDFEIIFYFHNDAIAICRCIYPGANREILCCS